MRLYPRDLLDHTLVLLDRDGIECASVSGDGWLPFASALAHGYDLEDAAQRGEPDPWSPEFPSDKEWEALRRMCAWVAIRVAFEGVLEDSRPCAYPVAQEKAAVSEPRGSHRLAQITTRSGESPMHNPILKHFAYSHLPPRLQDVSRAFHEIAISNAAALPDGPEKDMCLRKLLEAKDCAVRAALEGGE